MPEPSSYLDVPLGELCELLASDAAPGGGSAAAVAATMAASLTTKAARRSLDSWSEAPGVLAQARVLGARCADLARLDADAFRVALAALEEGEAVEVPLERAAAVLLELAETAADVAVLAARTAENGDGTFRGDAVSAAVLAAAATLAAEALVASNLTVTGSDARLTKAHSLAEEAAAASLRALAAGP
jgi:formiminotetrahydrofolate cyclodeaminase